MNDKYDRISDKLDKQTEILHEIKTELTKEITLLKLAHQKLKYTTIAFSVGIVMVFAKPQLQKLLPFLF